jgi:hypothetical protein
MMMKTPKSGITLLIVGGFIALMAVIRSGNKGHTDAPTVAGAEGCSYDWQRCADNADMANNNRELEIDAAVECQHAVADRVQYGSPTWPWFSFSHYRNGTDYVTSGIAILGEPDTQLQNEYGASVHVNVTCRYDLRARRVLDVSTAEPGLLRPSPTISPAASPSDTTPRSPVDDNTAPVPPTVLHPNPEEGERPPGLGPRASACPARRCEKGVDHRDEPGDDDREAPCNQIR